jgi:hypothetical protein
MDCRPLSVGFCSGRRLLGKACLDCRNGMSLYCSFVLVDLLSLLLLEFGGFDFVLLAALKTPF